ncbi:prephenate dehydrogenase/arogenate dehydrogenase family protein [Mariprofundus sp. EBB-1]|uniref:prephenate dehydrogenase n=1 Tax=Mariprofundus sp. EBB-1 TaxID=2650971 RepID=UPI000EF228DC|nr:prephenate dehydrogenase/arogenate dehydrogenase family protein [Mariprofundus sp. EBB-1]RLL51955.1 prephenate dehydrogenase/arogenate dehydrogenase family protein [Mariprofundus sp. EBB-1]
MNPIQHMVVIGTGLIGGSLSLALRKAALVERVTGVGRSRANLELAKELGIVDDWTHDIAEAVRGADMVVVAVPMSAYASVFKTMAPHLSATTIITDVGSTKQSAMIEARSYLSDSSRFVAGHPIAGTEQSGAGAAFAELFDGRLCILTPDADTRADAVQRVQEMWKVVGSRVMCMAPAEHDDFLAAVSHLPHLAAFALVNAVRKQGNEEHDPFEFAAGGFRDFTRIASSSPQMWRDIALCNRDAVIRQVDALQDELNSLKDALRSDDGEQLLEHFSSAKQARDAWLNTYGKSL